MSRSGGLIAGLPSVKLRGKGAPSESSRKSKGRDACEAQEEIANSMLAKYRDKPACVFLCGKKVTDADDVDEQSMMKWGYADGSGASCWYCNRTFLATYSRLQDREEFIEAVGKDMDVKTGSHENRSTLAERRKKGCKQSFDRRGGAISRKCCLFHSRAP